MQYLLMVEERGGFIVVPFRFILLAASDRAEEGIISELVSACNCQSFLKPSSTEPVV